jgi:hypothetical protein
MDQDNYTINQDTSEEWPLDSGISFDPFEKLSGGLLPPPNPISFQGAP